MNETKELFFIKNINHLFDIEYITKFIPTKTMTIDEQLNAIVRFTIYFSVLMFFIDKNACWVYLVFIVVSVCLIYYRKMQVTYVTSTQDEYSDECFLSTESNIYANKSVFDKEGIARCEENKELINEYEEKEKDRFENLDTIFGKNQFRNFYTTPVNGNLNNQSGYAEWLYGSVGVEKSLSFGNVK